MVFPVRYPGISLFPTAGLAGEEVVGTTLSGGELGKKVVRWPCISVKRQQSAKDRV